MSGIVHGLQGVREDDGVEGVVGKSVEPRVKVALDDIDAVEEGGEHVGIGDVDAVAADSALALQAGEQRAVAATEVEHARAGRDPALDQGEVGAQETHDPLPMVFAMRA